MFLSRLFSEKDASPLWLARRRIVVCSLLFEAAAIVALIVHSMLNIETNKNIGDALDTLLYIFASTVLGYAGIATWGDKNDMKYKAKEDVKSDTQSDSERG